MMAFLRKMLGISPIDTDSLRTATREQRQLARLARSERTEKIFQTVIAEVRK